jgi:serine/threonine protein kinase
LLGLNFVAVLKEGYSNDGVHAVIDDYLVNYPPVTNGHLRNLVRIVQTLFKEGMVHGDLRLPNILFGERDEVNLIDFEWAGPKGTTSFPVSVCKESFGPQASKQNQAGDADP